MVRNRVTNKNMQPKLAATQGMLNILRSKTEQDSKRLQQKKMGNDKSVKKAIGTEKLLESAQQGGHSKRKGPKKLPKVAKGANKSKKPNKHVKKQLNKTRNILDTKSPQKEKAEEDCLSIRDFCKALMQGIDGEVSQNEMKSHTTKSSSSV